MGSITVERSGDHDRSVPSPVFVRKQGGGGGGGREAPALIVNAPYPWRPHRPCVNVEPAQNLIEI